MVYLVFCYFLVLFIIVRKKYVGIASYLIAVYTFSLFFSILLFNSDSNINYTYTALVPSIIFCFTLLFYFIPFFKKKMVIRPSNNLILLNRFEIIGYVLSIILIICSLFLITKIQEAFAYGLVETRDAMYRGERIFTAYSPFERIGHSTLTWLSGMCYPLLIMFFYAFSFIKEKRLLKILLITSSLSATYLGLLSGGRTNLLYWVLFFIFCVILFWNYLSHKKKRLLLLISLIFFTFLTTYFVVVTIERAELGNDGDTGNFLLSYAGQSYLNFCYFLENLNFHEYSLQRILPLSSKLLLGQFDLTDYRDTIFSISGMNIGIFYTFLGDLYVDIGIEGMFIYSILYFFISMSVMRRKVFTLSDLLIIGILFQIPLHGVFYYSLWKIESSFCIIFTLIIARFLQSNKIIKW